MGLIERLTTFGDPKALRRGKPKTPKLLSERWVLAAYILPLTYGLGVVALTYLERDRLCWAWSDESSDCSHIRRAILFLPLMGLLVYFAGILRTRGLVTASMLRSLVVYEFLTVLGFIFFLYFIAPFIRNF
jgi:hypothetical protein